MDSVTVAKVKADLRKHKPEHLKICKDGAFKMAGISHFISKNDPEFLQPEGTMIPKARIEQWFAHDILMAIKDSETLVSNFEKMQDNIQRAIVILVFDIGSDELKRRWPKFLTYVEIGDYEGMVQEIAGSAWKKQEPGLAADLMRFIRDAESDNKNALRG